jgi:HTH-type transcriptional regulator, transcriptional repressor of NAD biosynthesis genes
VAADRPATGLVVGRFCPPHLGHDHLIDRAAEHVGELVVFVNTREGEVVPGELRAGWLAELHPDVTVVEVRHDLDTDFDDEALWAEWIALFRERWPLADGGPDVVFSSDHYADELARRLGAACVVVDADRLTVPISATRVREQPAEHLDFLAPPVRAWVEATWLTR